jgi:hypothetical protein
MLFIRIADLTHENGSETLNRSYHIFRERKKDYDGEFTLITKEIFYSLSIKIVSPLVEHKNLTRS